LRQSLENDDIDELWEKCRLYWQGRIDVLVQREANAEQCGQECLSFLLWLEHIPADIDEIVDVLEPTVRLANPEGFRWRTLLEYLVNQVDNNPVLTGQILLSAAQRLERQAGTELPHIRRVLEALLTSGHKDDPVGEVE
jgi:hypothetical protein